MSLRSALLDAWAVLSPVTCAGCGAPDRALCGACASALLADPVTTLVAGVPVTSALRYAGAAARVIAAFKDEGRTDLARPLATALSAAMRVALSDGSGPVEIAAPGGSRAGSRRRGYDPVAVLLRRSRVRRPARVLTRTRRTQTQKLLGRDARLRNLDGSLRARHVAGRRFLLIDDVVTTGATLTEAIRAIHAGGGTVVAAATLATTPRRAGSQLGGSDELDGNRRRRAGDP